MRHANGGAPPQQGIAADRPPPVDLLAPSGRPPGPGWVRRAAAGRFLYTHGARQLKCRSVRRLRSRANDPNSRSVRRPSGRQGSRSHHVDPWNCGSVFMPRSRQIHHASFAGAPPRRAASSRWWVAERTGPSWLIGIPAQPRPDRSDSREVDTIAVDPPAGGTGVGRALMFLALQWLRSDGYRSALLWTLVSYPRAASSTSNRWRLNGASRRLGRSALRPRPLADWSAGSR